MSPILVFPFFRNLSFQMETCHVDDSRLRLFHRNDLREHQSPIDLRSEADCLAYECTPIVHVTAFVCERVWEMERVTV